LIPTRPITNLLVANRGEIARRIFRTARDLGMHTVAIHSDGDADAPFVREADVAVALGGRTAMDTYLDVDKVLEAARRSGADGIHPGYGFLSENADFARAVVSAGITWVGPSPDAIAAMGDKLAAKRLMTEAGVPTLPAAELGPDDDLATAGKKVGFPLLVKAAAGGGGKGMRVVESEDDLETAVAGARREAGAAFGNDTIFLERWLARSRHVEIQVLGDQQGNLVHCFERECSIQRRHQKIIEEAPSPAVSPELRERMGAAALCAAKAIGYVSAGTVEFLLEDGRDDFWFLEVNTRLQVEHPVTEAITGLDLVHEQLRVAAGEPLGFTQDDLSIDGHAVEARLYSEDPANRFFPKTGKLLSFVPPASPEARFDSGVESGCLVGIEFDPMLAKVITHAPTRSEASLRLARVLETTRIQGLTTNRDFLVATLRHEAFLAGRTTTDFIEREEPDRKRVPSWEEFEHAAIATALAEQRQNRAEATLLPAMPSGWRNTPMPPEIRRFKEGKKNEIEVRYRARRDGGFDVEVGERRLRVEVRSYAGDSIDLAIDGLRSRYDLARDGARRFVHGPRGAVELTALPRFPKAARQAASGSLVAPMPGKVLSVHVAQGESVRNGQLLLILEAMKMEHRITATLRGKVSELRVAEGDQVEGGALLVVIGDK
jgi:propionyl-CoA carboxylase alpha chain